MKIPKIEKYENNLKYSTMFIPKVSNVEKTYNVMNEKDKIKLIKTVERIVRSSIEYKQYIAFLKAEIDMTQCSFFTNVTNKNGARVSIEIHHEPFTLFDITQMVTDKFIDEDRELNPLLIAEEVMLLHYKNMVGLIPLSSTVHGLVHDGDLFIPLQFVYGEYASFIKEYDKYLSSDNQSILQAKLRMSKEVIQPDLSILETRYVYLEVDGFKLPQVIN